MDLKKINLSNKSKLMQGLLAGIVGFAIALIFFCRAFWIAGK